MKINLSTRDQPTSQLSSIVRYCEGRERGMKLARFDFGMESNHGFTRNIIRVSSYYNLPPPVPFFRNSRHHTRQNPLKRPHVYSTIKILIIIIPFVRSFVRSQIYKRGLFGEIFSRTIETLFLCY